MISLSRSSGVRRKMDPMEGCSRDFIEFEDQVSEEELLTDDSLFCGTKGDLDPLEGFSQEFEDQVSEEELVTDEDRFCGVGKKRRRDLFCGEGRRRRKRRRQDPETCSCKCNSRGLIVSRGGRGGF